MSRDLEKGLEIMNLGQREVELMRFLSSKSCKVQNIKKTHKSGNREEAEKMLKDWLMQGEDTSDAIHTAIRLGYPNLVVDNFTKLKAEIDIPTLAESHTLLEAARAGNNEVVSLLIKFFQEKEPEKLEKLINFGEDCEFRTALHWACQNGLTDVVKTILASKVHNFVDIPTALHNCRDLKFTTPLHLSIKPSVTDENPPRVIPKSERRSRVELVDLLLEDPDGSELLNLKDSQGNTALHLAVETTNVDIVERLIKQTRLIATERNSEGKTPSQLVWDQIQLDSKKNDPDVKIIRKYLENLPDVKAENETLRDNSSMHYNAANNLLVGGALLAQLTFSGILSMVTLAQEFLTEECPADALAPSPEAAPVPSLSPAPALSPRCPDTHSHMMKLKGHYVRATDIFRASNNLSFFFSIITIVMTIQLIISRRQTVTLETEISHLRHGTALISLSLTFSIIFAVAAFISGGLANIPVAESGWGYVLSQWARGQSEAIFKSTMLTTTMVGLILIIPLILLPLVKDYFHIVRAYLETKIVSWDMDHAEHAIGPWRSFLTLILAILFLVATLFIMFMLIFGVGRLKNYIT